MGVILRTAGASRTKTEVKRDFEYLLRLWETVRDLTLNSTAPTLVYEEGSLVKRAIRDLYNKDIDDIIVAGDEAYATPRTSCACSCRAMPRTSNLTRTRKPLFTRHGIESQLDAMFSPVVQLRSGGYIVINQAEALVAIDVNSGRATREHHIEDTALKTNVEAADEIARQLRLRDLAGLIVIDYIDMDEKRNNRTVERRLKEALKHDRARIQVGRISHFGLLEMSRQRIRTRVLESSTEKCPECGGTGHVRSVSSVALQSLARHRGDADQERDALPDRAHPLRGRALHAQPQARASAGARRALPAHHHGVCRRKRRRRRCPISSTAASRCIRAEAARNLAAAARSAAPVEEEPLDEAETEAETGEEAEAEAEAEAEEARAEGEPKTAAAGAAGVAADAGADATAKRARKAARAPLMTPRPSTRSPTKTTTPVRRRKMVARPKAAKAKKPPPARTAIRKAAAAAGVAAAADAVTGAAATARTMQEAPYQNGEGGPEPELRHAVEDLDRPPTWDERAEPPAKPSRSDISRPMPSRAVEPAMRPSTAEAEFPAPVGHDAPEALRAEAEAESR